VLCPNAETRFSASSDRCCAVWIRMEPGAQREEDWVLDWQEPPPPVRVGVYNENKLNSLYRSVAEPEDSKRQRGRTLFRDEPWSTDSRLQSPQPRPAISTAVQPPVLPAFWRIWLVVVAFGAVLTTLALGARIGDVIQHRYPTPLTPSGPDFVVWVFALPLLAAAIAVFLRAELPPFTPGLVGSLACLALSLAACATGAQALLWVSAGLMVAAAACIAVCYAEAGCWAPSDRRHLSRSQLTVEVSLSLSLGGSCVAAAMLFAAALDAFVRWTVAARAAMWVLAAAPAFVARSSDPALPLAIAWTAAWSIPREDDDAAAAVVCGLALLRGGSAMLPVFQREKSLAVPLS